MRASSTFPRSPAHAAPGTDETPPNAMMRPARAPLTRLALESGIVLGLPIVRPPSLLCRAAVYGPHTYLPDSPDVAPTTANMAGTDDCLKRVAGSIAPDAPGRRSAFSEDVGPFFS